MIIYIEKRDGFVILRALAGGDGIVGEMVKSLSPGESFQVGSETISYEKIMSDEKALIKI